MMKNYDLLIVGGGATGCGIALDASLRGLRVVLVEQNDISEGTSSRSTKLAHGGVRYLEAAVKHLDKEQYNLVREGLRERYRLLKNAAHLSKKVSLITPIYSWFELPYIFAGLSLYDLISGKYSLGRSKIVTKKDIISSNPSVKKDGLKAGVLYYDGAFNDARMAVALAQSARQEGAVIKNYTKLERFIFKNEKIVGAEVYDKLNDSKEVIEAKYIINATGVFSDTIRKLADEKVKSIIKPSSGIHIVIDRKFLPSGNGLMIPKTKDGRVLFMLPFMGKTLVGTTDNEATPTQNPKVKDSDIEYLLEHINSYFDTEITKNDIIASFCGLRPLIDVGKEDSTSTLVREHIIEELECGLITIAGGKWTTYRSMAEELVDFVLCKDDFKEIDKTCKTYDYKIIGSKGDLKGIKDRLDKIVTDKELSDRLFSMYGDRVWKVLEFEKDLENPSFLDEKYKIVKAELLYAIDCEFVKKAEDFVYRRVCIGLIDENESRVLIENTKRLMGETD